MAEETANADSVQIPDLLPVLPLKDVVLFPYVIVPLSVSREKSIAAVDAAPSLSACSSRWHLVRR